MNLARLYQILAQGVDYKTNVKSSIYQIHEESYQLLYMDGPIKYKYQSTNAFKFSTIRVSMGLKSI